MLKNAENETSILAIRSYFMVKLCTFMKKATYFVMFKPFKKKIPNFFRIFADFLALKFHHFCPFGLAPGYLFWPKMCWAKPWPCPKPIRSHLMQVHWHSIAKNPTKVENTVFIFSGLKVATFCSIFHLNHGPQNTNLGALGVLKSILAYFYLVEHKKLNS